MSGPRNRREARRWVREHWQAFIRSAGAPDLRHLSPEAADLVFEVFCDEGQRLADRLEPRTRP